MKDYHNEKFIQYLGMITAIVAEGQDKGLFRREINPEIARRAFFGGFG